MVKNSVDLTLPNANFNLYKYMKVEISFINQQNTPTITDISQERLSGEWMIIDISYLWIRGKLTQTLKCVRKELSKTKEEIDTEIAKKLLEKYDNKGAREVRDGHTRVSVFGRQCRFNLNESFPLLTHRQHFLRAAFEEVMWYLRGETDNQILKDKNVKAIFVNIFGGIVRCDRVANGIIEATKLTNVSVPVIVRLDGTNAEEAKEILKNSNIANLIAAENLADGAKKAVKAAKGEF